MTAQVTLSAFGDEIDNDLETQLDVLSSENIFALELRGAWGKNVLDLNEDEIAQAKMLLQKYGFRVSAIGSPIGKSQLSQPPSFEQGRMERALAAADAFETPLIRVFSFHIDADEAEAKRDEIITRMAALADQAGRVGITLVHENEKGIYGDTPERCLDLLTSIDSLALRMAFDPANFVQVGVRPMEQAWPLLKNYVTHVHIKDALLDGGHVRPAGEGDGDVPGLLAALAERGYTGYLTLEPHLQIAGPSGGFSGEAGMRTAAEALRKLMSALGDRVQVE